MVAASDSSSGFSGEVPGRASFLTSPELAAECNHGDPNIWQHRILSAGVNLLLVVFSPTERMHTDDLMLWMQIQQHVCAVVAHILAVVFKIRSQLSLTKKKKIPDSSCLVTRSRLLPSIIAASRRRHRAETRDVFLFLQAAAENVSACSRRAAAAASLTCGLVRAKDNRGGQRRLWRANC